MSASDVPAANRPDGMSDDGSRGSEGGASSWASPGHATGEAETAAADAQREPESSRASEPSSDTHSVDDEAIARAFRAVCEKHGFQYGGKRGMWLVTAHTSVDAIVMTVVEALSGGSARTGSDGVQL